MDEGRVVEIGRHDELTDKPDGIYAKLVAAQQFDDEGSADKQSVNAAAEYRRQESRMTEQTEGRSHSGSIVPAIGVRRRRQSVAQVSIMSGSSRYGGYNAGLEFDRRLSSPSEESLEAELRAPSGKKPFWSSGLALLYRNCQGSYAKLGGAILLTTIRGADLAMYSIVLNVLFIAYEHVRDEKREQFSNEMFWIGAFNACVAIVLVPVVFGSVGHSHSDYEFMA